MRAKLQTRRFDLRVEVLRNPAGINPNDDLDAASTLVLSRKSNFAMAKTLLSIQTNAAAASQLRPLKPNSGKPRSRVSIPRCLAIPATPRMSSAIFVGGPGELNLLFPFN